MQKTTGVTLIDRVLGAARLDPQVYDEVASDTRATPQAVLVVALAGLATAIGYFGSEDDFGFVLFRRVAEGLIGWGVWTSTSYFVGTTMLRSYAADTSVSWRQLARTTGFAHSPLVLRALMVIPSAFLPVLTVTMFWQLAAMTVAVRQTLDYASLWRASAVAVLGYVVSTVVVAALQSQ